MEIFRGLSVKQLSEGRRPVREADTSVIGIVGTAAKGELNKLYRITTLKEAFDTFGDLPKKDDNSYSLVKSLSTIIRQNDTKVNIVAVRVSETEGRLAPLNAGAWEDFSAARLRHTWGPDDIESQARTVMQAMAGPKPVLKLTYEGLSGNNLASFKADIEGEDWSDIKTLRIDFKNTALKVDDSQTPPVETPIAVEVNVIIVTGAGDNQYKSLPISLSDNNWLNDHEIDLTAEAFKSAENDWAGANQTIDKLTNVRGLIFQVTTVESEPFDGDLCLANIELIAKPEDELGPRVSVASNVIGNEADKTGVFSLLTAVQTLGLKPNFVLAPIYSEEKTVADSLFSVARKLKALAVLDRKVPASGSLPEDNIENQYSGAGSSRLKVLYPRIKMAIEGEVGYSALWVGIRVRINQTRGFWVPASNKQAFGVEDIATDIEYIAGSPSEADDLARARVTTLVRDQGWRVWGNRTLASGEDSKYSFETHRQIADAIDATARNILFWTVDQDISEAFIVEVVESLNDYLRSLVSDGAIYGGESWFDPDKNPEAQLADGTIVFTHDYTPVGVSERVILESIITNRYISELFA